MADNNGKNGWLLKSIVGFLFLIIFTVISTMGNYVISNDKESRGRDDKMEDKCEDTNDEQQQVNQAILVTLAEIKKDVKYLRQTTVPGG